MCPGVVNNALTGMGATCRHTLTLAFTGSKAEDWVEGIAVSPKKILPHKFHPCQQCPRLQEQVTVGQHYITDARTLGHCLNNHRLSGDKHRH